MDEKKQLAALAAGLAASAGNDRKVVPFGKYKGQPVEVMRRDQAYMDWAYGQEGIRTQYPWIFSITVNTGAEPTETPEHNRYQALFLDRHFAADVYDHVFPRELENRLRWDLCVDPKCQVPFIGPLNKRMLIETSFEVSREVRDGPYRTRRTGPADVQLGLDSYGYSQRVLRIEIKPSMGDDYPAVLRQMRAAECNVLYLVDYTGSGATLEQVCQMFNASGIHVLMHSEFWEDDV